MGVWSMLPHATGGSMFHSILPSRWHHTAANFARSLSCVSTVPTHSASQPCGSFWPTEVCARTRQSQRSRKRRHHPKALSCHLSEAAPPRNSASCRMHSCRMRKRVTYRDSNDVSGY
eukprot:3401501-Rhodomonas_salina.1